MRQLQTRSQPERLGLTPLGPLGVGADPRWAASAPQGRGDPPPELPPLPPGVRRGVRPASDRTFVQVMEKRDGGYRLCLGVRVRDWDGGPPLGARKPGAADGAGEPDGNEGRGRCGPIPPRCARGPQACTRSC